MAFRQPRISQIEETCHAALFARAKRGSEEEHGLYVWFVKEELPLSSLSDAPESGRPAWANLVLKALPPEDLGILQPHLEQVYLSRRQILMRAGEYNEYVYFPGNGIISFVMTMPQGARVEFGLVGRDNLTCMSSILGLPAPDVDVVVQIEDTAAQRIRTTVLQAAMEESARLRARFMQCVYSFMLQLAQTAVSNSRHRLDARLARWLLMCHDRIDGDEIAITHDFLAMMLAVQRTSVTSTLHILEGEGLIRSTRGRVRILHRQGLENQAGEAYHRGAALT